MQPYKQKHFAKEPVITQIPKEYKELDILALFLIAYSNRIMFKTCVRLRRELQLPIYIHTLHIRYMLLMHFIACSKAHDKWVRQADIERSDYPKHDVKRVNLSNDLVRCNLAESTKKTTKGKTTLYYRLTDMGYLAVNMLIEQIHEVYHTQPTIQGSLILRDNINGALNNAL